MLGHKANDPICSAAKREWVLRAGGLESQREHTSDGVGFVGERKQCALGSARDGIICRFRTVMIVNRIRNCWLMALRAGVESADDALELGEFFDELGGEIGLRQPCGFVKRIAVNLVARMIEVSSADADQMREPLG